jgi:hypothetical protein
LLAFAADAGAFAALGGQHVGVAGVGITPAQVVLQLAGQRGVIPVVRVSSSAATNRAIAGTSVPDADAMMIIARRTRTDPCFPRRTICSSRRPS